MTATTTTRKKCTNSKRPPSRGHKLNLSREMWCGQPPRQCIALPQHCLQIHCFLLSFLSLLVVDKYLLTWMHKISLRKLALRVHPWLWQESIPLSRDILVTLEAPHHCSGSFWSHRTALSPVTSTWQEQPCTETRSCGDRRSVLDFTQPARTGPYGFGRKSHLKHRSSGPFWSHHIPIGVFWKRCHCVKVVLTEWQWTRSHDHVRWLPYSGFTHPLNMGIHIPWRLGMPGTPEPPITICPVHTETTASWAHGEKVLEPPNLATVCDSKQRQNEPKRTAKKMMVPTQTRIRSPSLPFYTFLVMFHAEFIHK